ncbi:VanZ family protein [uncultured Tenacibaculum sp.]|uniref:VanZ family protein n=1 Tax=uncultured Tenacibaculum sp. TaxID=174713 RepID=UPI00261BD349|nr:VanZ family protein [uncultured Tenacibaculum sp.]
MQKDIKKLFKDNSIIIAIGVTISIAILSLAKLGKYPLPISFSNIDKIEHAIAYFFLTLFWLLALKNKVSIAIIVLCCFAYGIIIEVLQGVLTTYRFAEYYDILANTIGILIAFIFFRVFIVKK